MELQQVFLQVSDLDRSRAFYEALEFDTSNIGSQSVTFDMGAAELKLNTDFPAGTLSAFGMTPPDETAGDGSRGAGAVVVIGVSNVDAVATAAADADGGEVLAGPRTVDWGRYVFLVADPDGYVLEFSHPIHAE